MNIQYQNELESSIYYLKKEIEQLKKQKQEVLDFIEKKCIYDEHLMGYVRGIERKDTATLVYKLTGKYPRDLDR
jgi:hypothetical protein